MPLDPDVEERLALLDERLGTIAEGLTEMAGAAVDGHEAEASATKVGATAMENTQRITRAAIALMLALLGGGGVGGWRLFERVEAAEAAAEKAPKALREQAEDLATTNATRLDEVDAQVENVANEVLRQGDDTADFLLYLSDKIDEAHPRAGTKVDEPPTVQAKRQAVEAKRQVDRVNALLHGGQE